MLVDDYPHLRSPVSCLFYQFAFKRYIDEDVFTDDELDCIHNEIASAVCRFDKLVPNHYSFDANTLPQYSVTLDVNPSLTPLYRFLFNSYAECHILPIEEISVIHTGILELVERFNEIKGYRACQDTISLECENVPSSFSRGNNDASENRLETDAETADVQFVGTSSDGGKKHYDGRICMLSCPPSPLNPSSVDLRCSTDTVLSTSIVSEIKDCSVSAASGFPDGLCQKDYSNCTPFTSQWGGAFSPNHKGTATSKEVGIDPLSDVELNVGIDGHRHRLRLVEYAKPYSGIEVIISDIRSRNCEGKGFNRPLGVTFDEKLQQWIVADTLNNRVVLVPSGTVMTSPRITAPCAVVVLRPAISFAVLTKSDIRIMYYDKRESDLVISHSGNARGMSLTERGNLVIMEKIRGFWQVSVYEGKPDATLVWSYPYPTIQDALPSFLDLYRGVLVVTDLGTQSIVKFYDNSGADKFQHERSITLASNPKIGRRGNISYISGVFIDDDFNLLIADAKGRSLQVLNSDCIYLYSVKLMSGSFPYISGIWVNRSGYIGVCARGQKDGGLHVYRMKKPEALTK